MCTLVRMFAPCRQYMYVLHTYIMYVSYDEEERFFMYGINTSLFPKVLQCCSSSGSRGPSVHVSGSHQLEPAHASVSEELWVSLDRQVVNQSL